MASSSAPLPAPVMDEVAAICAIRDPVIRNLRITECYHRLSFAMASRTGACASWCTFATWASRQAGATIRAEDLLDRLAAKVRPGWSVLRPFQSLWRALLRKGIFNPETTVGRIVRAVYSPFDAFERGSDAVARGNLKVFAEIAHEFARYLKLCRPDSGIEADEFQRFLSSFQGGPPPEGQDLLRRAFTRYHQQQFEAVPERRAQLILCANLEIGLHEQTRLQPEIQEALEAGPDTADDLGGRVLSACFPQSRVARAFRLPLGLIALRFRRFARELTRRTITESLMVLRMPGVVLALGRNLDHACPEILQAIDEPELQDLLNAYEPRGSACDDCGAEDWADLRQRMHYILHLFRAFHLNRDLFAPPFSAGQVEQIMAGRVPAGEL